MSEQIQIFNHEQFGKVRIIYNEEQDVVWFAGKDIAEILEYKEPNKAINRHVDRDDRMKHPITDNLGRTQKSWIINESGMYALIFGSKLEKAKEFKRWVTSEVLPSIRKHGGYLTEKKIEEVLTNPDTIIQLATKLKDEMERSKQLKLENNKKNQLIGELKPKADYTDSILKNKGLVTITQIAKDYGLSGREMNKILHKLKIQYKQSDQWLLYSQHHGKGYTHSETIDITRADGTRDIKMNTKWTQKGRLFLYNKLKENGYIPKIEIEEEEKIS